MWVEKLKNGKVRYAERYMDPLTMKQKKVSIVMDKDTASTRKIALEALTEKANTFLSPPTDQQMTLGKLVEFYQEAIKVHLKPSTVRRNILYTRTLLKLLDKDILVDRLNANTIKTAFYKNGNPVTYNERLTRFKAFIRWAYENDYVKDIQWIDKLKTLPNPEKKQKLKDKYLEKKELHTLLNAMDIKVWRYLTQLMVLSGMRVGEAMALERDNFDFKARLIYIDKTLDHINKATNSPKTFTSKRQVYMQKELYLLCGEIYQESLNNNLRYGHSSPLLFADENGNYVNYYSYNKYLKENSQVCLGKAISTHILRHTHTSLMAEAGVSLEAISRRLGHASSRVTREIYLHITSKQKDRDNAEFENVDIL